MEPLLNDLLSATRTGRVSWEMLPDHCDHAVGPDRINDEVADDRLWISDIGLQAEAFGWNFHLRRSRGLSTNYTTGAPVATRTERHSLSCYSLVAESGKSRDGRFCCLEFPARRQDGAAEQDIANLFRAIAPMSKVWKPPVLPSHDDLVAALRHDLAQAALSVGE